MKNDKDVYKSVNTMKKQLAQLNKINTTAQSLLQKASTVAELEALRIKFLGRKSELTVLLRSIREVPAKDRAQFGKIANKTRVQLEEQFDKKQKELKEIRTKGEDLFDVTIPGKKTELGHLNPDTLMMWELADIFERMGFEVWEPFDVDNDYNNFEAVNMPPGHPARDMWDTFWTEDGFIPITHTSAMQNRILKSRQPPIRAAVIGHTFRNERTDARHEHTLFQCEGVYVDKGVTQTDMIGTLEALFEEVFEKDVEVMITPDYFPFVEPGNGMALTCVLCDGKGCRVCKNTGWLEILGCGMIHPNVLRAGGIDPAAYSGFAWGFGVDRLAMLKYKIDDVRLFHSGDLRFIKQF